MEFSIFDTLTLKIMKKKHIPREILAASAVSLFLFFVVQYIVLSVYLPLLIVSFVQQHILQDYQKLIFVHKLQNSPLDPLSRQERGRKIHDFLGESFGHWIQD